MGSFIDVYCFSVLRSRSNRTVAWLKGGHWLAIGLIATNLIGDITNVMLGTEPRAIVGIPIAAAILLYLLSKNVRRSFRRTSDLE